MTERERLLTVLDGKTPDQVPWFPDLGHWYRSEAYERWDLYAPSKVDQGIYDLHREVKGGAYIDAGALYAEEYTDDVQHSREMVGEKAIERFITPIGEIRMERTWSALSFSWDVTKLMIESIEDLKILTYAVERKKIVPKLSNWDVIESNYKDIGLGFPHLGYTGLGFLISYYMGVENTIFATYDEPELLKKFIDTYNAKQMEIVNVSIQSPAPHFIFGDNLSGDVQPPSLFNVYSFDHYKNIADTVHSAGKTLSAHLDGMLNEIITVVANTGVDVADAVTPTPTGDLTPMEIRKQAGDKMILFGGIAPNMWMEETPEKDFVQHVKDWLALRNISSRLVQSAGDQVPPGTKLKRIKLVRDIVDEFGRYE